MDNKIYIFLQKIPKGKVVSYKQLGCFFSLHPRSVAKILSKNQNQDVFPCYKVINSNGRIGGYKLGLEEKIKKLESDGILINNGTIDYKFFWNPKKQKFL